MTVRVRGIYATALTAMFDDIVQASEPIARRFDESFPVEPADVSVDTTDDRQGVGLHGTAEGVEALTARLEATGRDTLSWKDPLSRGGVYAGEVTETLGSGALVDCGDGTGFLPYSKTARRIEEGDRLRVQVTEPQPPWRDSRAVLDTTVRIHGELASLVRGGTSTAGTPELADILPAEPPDGWAVQWEYAADDAGLDALSDTLESLGTRAGALDEAFTDAPAPADTAPHCYWAGESTRWVWFGRESRFELDARRREVVPTMVGHHRIKAGTDEASSAVDFVEGICEELWTSEGSEADSGDDSTAGDNSSGGLDTAFPFETVTQQFGPDEGDDIHIGHGKPDGRRIELGTGVVTSRTPEGQLTVRRELSGRGTYDALGVQKQEGDVALTKFKEGRWWYPTVYRGADGQRRGTYVNICTPVEIFPREVRYVDLHVDVVKHADGTVKRVDDDELDAAVDAGTVSVELAEQARSVASALESAL